MRDVVDALYLKLTLPRHRVGKRPTRNGHTHPTLDDPRQHR
jgi:hypothetical protein